MTNFDLLKSWYKRVWEEGDLDAIDDFFHEQAEETGLIPEMHVQPQEFRDLIEAFMSLVEAPHFDLRLISDCGGWVTVAVTVRAHGVDGGPPVSVNGMVAVQILDGKFLQAINSFDFMKLFEDLEILPPGAMLSCLTGVRLRVPA